MNIFILICLVLYYSFSEVCGSKCVTSSNLINEPSRNFQGDRVYLSFHIGISDYQDRDSLDSCHANTEEISRHFTEAFRYESYPRDKHGKYFNPKNCTKKEFSEYFYNFLMIRDEAIDVRGASEVTTLISFCGYTMFPEGYNDKNEAGYDLCFRPNDFVDDLEQGKESLIHLKKDVLYQLDYQENESPVFVILDGKSESSPACVSKKVSKNPMGTTLPSNLFMIQNVDWKVEENGTSTFAKYLMLALRIVANYIFYRRKDDTDQITDEYNARLLASQINQMYNITLSNSFNRKGVIVASGGQGSWLNAPFSMWDRLYFETKSWLRGNKIIHEEFFYPVLDSPMKEHKIDFKCVSVILPDWSGIFVGREEIVRKMKDALLANENVVLHGVVGTGKTWIAAEIFREMITYYDIRVWIDADELAATINKQRKCYDIGIDIGVCNATRMIMENLIRSSYSVLVVVDNFEERTNECNINDFVTDTLNVVTLITTRENLRLKANYSSIEVKNFTVEEGRKYFFRKTNIRDRMGAIELTKKMGGHPIYLSALLEIIRKEEHRNFSSTIKLLEESSTAVCDFVHKEIWYTKTFSEDRNFTKVFSLYWEMLRKSRKVAEVFMTSTILSPTGVWIKFLDWYFNDGECLFYDALEDDAVGKICAFDAWTTVENSSTIHLAKSYGGLSTTSRKLENVKEIYNFHIHRAMRSMAWCMMSSEEKERSLEGVARTLVERFNFDFMKEQSYYNSDRLIAHIDHVYDRFKELEMSIPLRDEISTILRRKGEYYLFMKSDFTGASEYFEIASEVLNSSKECSVNSIRIRLNAFLARQYAYLKANAYKADNENKGDWIENMRVLKECIIERVLNFDNLEFGEDTEVLSCEASPEKEEEMILLADVLSREGDLAYFLKGAETIRRGISSIKQAIMVRDCTDDDRMIMRFHDWKRLARLYRVVDMFDESRKAMKKSSVYIKSQSKIMRKFAKKYTVHNAPMLREMGRTECAYANHIKKNGKGEDEVLYSIEGYTYLRESLKVFSKVVSDFHRSVIQTHGYIKTCRKGISESDFCGVNGTCLDKYEEFGLLVLKLKLSKAEGVEVEMFGENEYFRNSITNEKFSLKFDVVEEKLIQECYSCMTEVVKIQKVVEKLLNFN